MLKKVSIREVQDEMLRLLKIVDRICIDNGIEYWLDHGTLLGSIRQESFIPWDDDLDICLMHKDYIKLLSYLQEEADNNKNIFLLFNSNKGVNQYWCEYLCSTKYVFGYSGKNVTPVRIDIFPMKSISPSDKYKDKSINSIAQYFCRGDKKGLRGLDKKYIKKEISEALAEKKSFMSYYNKSYMSSCNKTQLDSLVTYSYGDSINKGLDYFRYSDIFPLSKVKFEDSIFFAPRNYKKYLTMIYGAYTKLPPFSERNPERTHFYYCTSVEFTRQKSIDYIQDLNSMFFYRDSFRQKSKILLFILKNKGIISLIRRVFKKLECIRKI